MTDNSVVAKRIFLASIPPVLCSILIGFLFAQTRVFDRHYSSFQFLWGAVIASVFYSFLAHSGKRSAFAALFVLFFLTLFVTGSTTTQYILRDILWVLGIGVTMYLYFVFVRKTEPLHYIVPPFALAGLSGILYIVTSEIHLLILRMVSSSDTAVSYVSLAQISAFYGVLIGFAVGTGISIKDKLGW